MFVNASASTHPRLLFLQSSGLSKPEFIQHKFSSWLISRVSLCEDFDFNCKVHSAGVTAVNSDPDEGRYTLAGGADGTIYLHDLGVLKQKTSELALHIGRSSKYCHKHQIDTITWGLDSGLFISSGRDGDLKVWDTNRGAPVEQFDFGTTIHKHALSGQEVPWWQLLTRPTMCS